MSVLRDVLIEEYDRCMRHKKARQDALKRHSKGSPEYIQTKQIIRNINKDIRMLHRALGPSLYFKWCKWAKEDMEYKQQMMRNTRKE